MAPDSVAWPMVQTIGAPTCPRAGVEPQNGEERAGTGHSCQGKTGEGSTERATTYQHHQRQASRTAEQKRQEGPTAEHRQTNDTLGGAG